MQIPRRVLAGAGALLALVAAFVIVYSALPGGTSSPSAAGDQPSASAPSTPSTADGAGVDGLAAASPRPSATRSPSLPAGARTVTLVNRLDQRVWAAATPDKAHPLAATGWVLDPGQSVSVVVPSGWGGRFWGRTGCTFDASGKGHCATGDCGGRLQCAGSGAPPATLAEFALAAWGGMDFYDVSLVDGANLPMWINVAHQTGKDPVSADGCVPAGCTRPIDCPEQMRGPAGTCRTPCAAFGGDAYCCRGAWSGREHCVPSRWPVDYTQVYKRAEPYAYSYAYDDSATMACKGGCSYRITFGLSP